MRAVLLKITGRVQGVGYRAWTVREATRLGLDGWVRNRTDGSVEAYAAGDPADVAALIEACRRGPALAQVRDVAVSDEAAISQEADTERAAAFSARPSL